MTTKCDITDFFILQISINLYYKERNMRTITPEHIEAYQQGCLKKLFDIIKNDPELSFEIRTGNEVIVYYRTGKILTIKYKDKDIKIKPLEKGYIKDSILIDPFDKKHLKDTLKHKDAIIKYLKKAKELVHKYKIGLEFSVQQNIALGNQNFDNRFLVVDMEWEFSQSGINKADRIGGTRIDLIIVDTQPNELGTNDIYLAELKAGTGATGYESGIIDHIKKTKTLIDKEEVCNDLKSDVENIIDIKSRLGLITGTKKELKLSSKPKMMIILAYRGDIEREQLEEKALEAIEEAKNLGMCEPLIKYHDLQITLE